MLPDLLNVFSGNTVAHLHRSAPHTVVWTLFFCGRVACASFLHFPRDTALERRRVQARWLIGKTHLLQAQERPILKSRKSNKGSRRPAGVSKELQAELGHNKGGYKKQKEGLVTHEEYRAAL